VGELSSLRLLAGDCDRAGVVGTFVVGEKGEVARASSMPFPHIGTRHPEAAHIAVNVVQPTPQ